MIRSTAVLSILILGAGVAVAKDATIGKQTSIGSSTARINAATTSKSGSSSSRDRQKAGQDSVRKSLDIYGVVPELVRKLRRALRQFES